MIQITDITPQTMEVFVKMCADFYNSKAVLHKIPIKNMEDTAKEAINKSPFVRCLVIEYEGKTAGFGILSFTYSNEAGGMVVFLEELYIKEEYRSLGIGKQYFEWIFKNYNAKAKRYRLEFAKENMRVHKLYKSIGFKDFDYLQMVMDI